MIESGPIIMYYEEDMKLGLEDILFYWQFPELVAVVCVSCLVG